MDIYVVRDAYEGYVEGIYDLEGIKKEYPKLIVNPPHYTNKDYWNKWTNVMKFKLNSEDGEYVDPEDIRTPLGLENGDHSSVG